MEKEASRLHWNATYESKREDGVSWFQDSPEPSLSLINEIAHPGSAIVDVGGGASRLVDNLQEQHFEDVAVLDLSTAAIAAARSRLAEAGEQVDWIVADIRTWSPTRLYDVWHDRAAFHFMVEKADRDAYLFTLRQALAPDGYAIIATFALDGPEKCSGLPVQRYDANSLAQALGPGFAFVRTLDHLHLTPWGSSQSFQFSVFRRAPAM
ncbi:class I SAM-dependent methyltransferase [Mesorhizobium sp. NZP2298]|nr:class I SAM-dependent methyltransferase [Mesorhizobium sp. NZP2298]